MKKRTNIIAFGLGTIGRDMVYVLIGLFLIVFLTEVIDLDNKTMWWITTIIVAARIFDAINDPLMGVIIDNTKSRWGKFKPWIASGAVAAGVFTILLFINFDLTGTKFIIYFSVIYILWGISYTANDISYWSMLPALSTDHKYREKIGVFSRICAGIGFAAAVVGFYPITNALTKVLDGRKEAFLVFAVVVSIIMITGQSITLFGVKEPRRFFKQKERTSLKGMFYSIIKNDQLLYVAIAMAL